MNLIHELHRGESRVCQLGQTPHRRENSSSRGAAWRQVSTSLSPIAPRSRRALGGTERREVHAGRPLRFARPGHAVAHAAFGHEVGRSARIVAKLAP